MKNVDLPEHEQELTDDRVAHDPPIITSLFVIGFRFLANVKHNSTLTYAFTMAGI
jgi:hypothetical protein